jgi:hypothetical protein
MTIQTVVSASASVTGGTKDPRQVKEEEEEEEEEENRNDKGESNTKRREGEKDRLG